MRRIPDGRIHARQAVNRAKKPMTVSIKDAISATVMPDGTPLLPAGVADGRKAAAM